MSVTGIAGSNTRGLDGIFLDQPKNPSFSYLERHKEVPDVKR